MKLRTRLTFLVTGAVAMAVVLVSASAYFLARAQMRSVIDRSLLERAELAQGFEGGPSALIARQEQLMSLMEGGFIRVDLYVGVVSASGVSVGASSQGLVLPVSKEDAVVASGKAGPVFRDVAVKGLHLRMVTAAAGEDGLAIQLARPLTEVDQTLARLALVLGLVGLGGVALAAGLGLAVSHSSLAPLSSLSEAVEHVAETQDLESRIDVERDDEIGYLAAAFNTMLEALETSRVQQQQLVADASHELRTPLTSLRTNIEFLARAEGMQDEDRSALMDDVSFEMRELSSLVAEMVELATSTKSGDEPLEGVDLTDTVEEVVGRARRRTGRTITVIGNAGHVEGRPNSLQRAISNLLDNAHKWSPPDGTIEVSLTPGRIEVADHGPGISQEDLDHVFDRFYRATEARSLPGSGLGLSIVKEIITQHGGSVFAFNRNGAVVGFEIPVA
jgi:two-component system, OmpR family, sensor histidine kinase MprB